MGTAITMYIAVLFLMSWVPPHWKRRAVGYGFISDITVHVVLQSLFGGDANGRAGLLLAGVLINITMHAYRKFCGYELLTMEGWVRHSPGPVVPTPVPPAGTTQVAKRRAPATRKGAAARRKERQA